MQNPIKLGLIDDEFLALERLSYLIKGIPGFEIAFSETDPLKGLDLARQHACDILLTDIQMERLNGLLISEEMEVLDIPVIICSAYPEFALPSIHVSVAGFLLKPVQILDLKKILVKTAKKMESRRLAALESQLDFIFLQDADAFGHVRIPFTEILYVEQIRNYSYFHVPPKVYRQRSTLYAIEKQLPTSLFIRVHNSFIINYRKMEKLLGNELQMVGGKSIPVSSHYRNLLLKTGTLPSPV